MFTGIIEKNGVIVAIQQTKNNVVYEIKSDFASELKVDQSIAHEGICLTVTAINGSIHSVTAIDETIKKTNMLHWQIGKKINLERCMKLGDRLDGHLVQGHVDGIGIVSSIAEAGGSWEFIIKYDVQFKNLLVEKGSICLNGISLTLVDVTNTTFKVCIIPYTYQHTSMQFLKINDLVNLEFDIIGKYIQRTNQ